MNISAYKGIIMKKPLSVDDLKQKSVKLEKELAKIDKKINKASNKMNQSPSSQSYTEFNSILDEKNKIKRELSGVVDKIFRFNNINKKIKDIKLNYSKDFHYQTEMEANNMFWQIPIKIRDEIEKETQLINENSILIQDYPIHEAGFKLDMKEWEDVFVDEKKEILCKVRTKVYGTDSPIFGKSGYFKFGNKVDTIAVCGLSDDEVNQKLKDELFEREIWKARPEHRNKLRETYLDKKEDDNE